MERGESILDAVLDEETLDFGGDDVEMADAEAVETPIPEPPAVGAGAAGGGAQAGGLAGKKKKKRKSGRSKNRGRPDGPPTKIGDINRRLKEKKSYLVWNAIGCLGVSAVSDLVREVEAIQKCGGQTIADGSRFRTGGGILWNILKSREPKAYKEIMVKGRELESKLLKTTTFVARKQFMYTKGRPQMSRNEDASSQGSVLVDEEIEAHDDPEHLVDAEEAPPSVDQAEPRRPVADRIRVPVAYDDLLEDGEIHKEQPQN
ncbi:hypothetical protein TRIUR3_25491 [Triticum urartu]|uniref:Phosphorylated adapter RNA export protein n=1 Tax=Triticum urartu TaxID=4572 RepID=M7ZSL7_TRIUA|nr:hypothetical protein TRIUR3_25491 [Triticum urartu]